MTTALTAAHYDAVTEGWRLVMGEAFHYGVFEAGDPSEPADALERATVRLNERMLQVSGPLTAGMRVLDVGCGVGGPARWLNAKTGASVLGVSNSPAGVEAARAVTAAAGLADQVTFAVADAVDTGLAGHSFDLVWVMESSHLMPDKPRLLSECARVVRPGGRVVLCDLILHEPFDLAAIFEQRRPLQCLDRVFGRAKIETVEGYRGWFERAGLRLVSETDLSAAVRPTLLAWSSNVATHRAALVGPWGEEALADFVAACEILRGYWDSGRMGYGLLAAVRPS